MLNAYSVRMTSRGLGSEKAVILEKVLSIKFSVNHSLSIFKITHFQSLDMVVVLLAYSTVQIWLMSSWYTKNPNMVDVLLVHKKSKYGCCPTGILKV